MLGSSSFYVSSSFMLSSSDFDLSSFLGSPSLLGGFQVIDFGITSGIYFDECNEERLSLQKILEIILGFQ